MSYGLMDGWMEGMKGGRLNARKEKHQGQKDRREKYPHGNFCKGYQSIQGNTAIYKQSDG